MTISQASQPESDRRAEKCVDKDGNVYVRSGKVWRLVTRKQGAAPGLAAQTERPRAPEADRRSG